MKENAYQRIPFLRVLHKDKLDSPPCPWIMVEPPFSAQHLNHGFGKPCLEKSNHFRQCFSSSRHLLLSVELPAQGFRKRSRNLRKQGTKKASDRLWLLTAVDPAASGHCATVQLLLKSIRSHGFIKSHPQDSGPDSTDLCPTGDKVDCDHLCPLLQIRHVHASGKIK